MRGLAAFQGNPRVSHAHDGQLHVRGFAHLRRSMLLLRRVVRDTSVMAERALAIYVCVWTRVVRPYKGALCDPY